MDYELYVGKEKKRQHLVNIITFPRWFFKRFLYRQCWEHLKDIFINLGKLLFSIVAFFIAMPILFIVEVALRLLFFIFGKKTKLRYKWKPTETVQETSN